jgi:hypothetical protein
MKCTPVVDNANFKCRDSLHSTFTHTPKIQKFKYHKYHKSHPSTHSRPPAVIRVPTCNRSPCSAHSLPCSHTIQHPLHSRCLHLSSFCTVVLPSFSPCKKSSNNVVDVTVSNCEDVQGCARMCKDVCKTHCQSWRSCSLAFQGKNSVSLMMSVCLCLLWKHLRLCRLFSLRFVMV